MAGFIASSWALIAASSFSAGVSRLYEDCALSDHLHRPNVSGLKWSLARFRMRRDYSHSANWKQQPGFSIGGSGALIYMPRKSAIPTASMGEACLLMAWIDEGHFWSLAAAKYCVHGRRYRAHLAIARWRPIAGAAIRLAGGQVGATVMGGREYSVRLESLNGCQPLRGNRGFGNISREDALNCARP